MEILYMIICVIIVLSVLVFIHEGGHYIAARAFGVRVSEFMIGLPGPNIGVVVNGTKFGVTAVPLGGYAKVCGMETGPISDNLEEVLTYVYRRGSACVSDVAKGCVITEEQAEDALDELVEWGSLVRPKRKDEREVYSVPATTPTKKQSAVARRLCLPKPESFAEGEARDVRDSHKLFELEYSQQYRALPFWKRSVILLAGITVNLLFAVIAFIIVYSVIGIDYTNPQTGEVSHIVTSPFQAIQIGISYIALTLQAILNLFNPETAAQTVSDSTSIVGIAVMSADYFSQGLVYGLFFMAAISISLGLMNLLPIPPLDGGRFLIEIIQKLTGREMSMKALSYVSMAGMALFMCFFVFMLNQDIQRFVLGNW